MARQSRLLGSVVLLTAATATYRLSAFVAGTTGLRSTATSRGQSVSDSLVTMLARGGEEDYSVTDEMIEKFHADTMTGSGGLPNHGSVVGSLIIKHFVGTFEEGKGFTRASKYKGPPPGVPGKRDMEPGVESLKEQMKLGKFVTKGGVGPFTDEADKVIDDGKGWVWLAADMTPGGLFLELFTSVPYGKRPLIVAKRDNVDEVFEKINWDMMDSRFDSTMGGPHIKQR
jgi:hypothetical protein